MKLAPVTQATLIEDLTALGLTPGMVVVVHTSFRAIRPVEGGPRALIAALRAVVGPQGTLVMPAHTGNLTDPADWRHPPVPPHTWHGLRLSMRPFDLAHTPTSGMGAVAETFRQLPGTLRSAHPVESICAQGPQAERIVARQPWNAAAGPDGPLGRLYDLDACVLLIGVGHDSNTSVHLAEHVANVPYRACDRVPVILHGRVTWQQVWGHAVCSGGFPRLDSLVPESRGPVGHGMARFMRQRDVVDVAVGLLDQEPLALLCAPGACGDCDAARAAQS